MQNGWIHHYIKKQGKSEQLKFQINSLIFLFSEFLATQSRQYFWSLINDVSSFDLFTPDARMNKKDFFSVLF